ncbi:hypothetical protein [Rheinheimera oceanensis]|uniref:hypothetical protein n=1 Tax=Rheinheimera oceanensis TaxID=2817449 RepID=UPI001BFDB837|nr:hypothetical protein [Rheinheimera oceanensis]
MGVGTYLEDLDCGGQLLVRVDSWSINYNFQGPDNRYKGTSLIISGNEIDTYIHAYKNNWLEYEKLKIAMPPDTELTKKGEMNMTIRIGGYWEGVCIYDYFMPLRAKLDLDNILSNYIYAKSRAKAVQDILIGLSQKPV